MRNITPTIKPTLIDLFILFNQNGVNHTFLRRAVRDFGLADFCFNYGRFHQAVLSGQENVLRRFQNIFDFGFLGFFCFWIQDVCNVCA